MRVYQLNPLTDPRWRELVERHPNASVFHSAGWLRALQHSYGYEPVAYTRSSPRSEIANAVVFSKIHSWATGRRLIALPFSDHCEPLVDSPVAMAEILSHACWEAKKNGYRFVEMRPLAFDCETLGCEAEFQVSESFTFHRMDLRPAADSLFRSFHKDCVQRKIRRAERERLEYKAGRSEQLLRLFFELMVKTRRRHGVPPQPVAWFRNLIGSLGDSLQIHVALKADRPVAAIMTMVWNDTLVYKYGCSDPQLSNLGGTPMLFWRAIEAAKSAGLSWFDLGRSDNDNAGLIAFKDHWGSQRSTLLYWRHPAPLSQRQSDWRKRLSAQVISRLPDSVLAATGRLLYRHIG